MEPIFITENEINDLNINLDSCFGWTDEMLKNKEGSLLPPKISIKPNEGYFYNVMPTVLPQFNIAGVKLVNRYPNRVPSLNSKIMLYDYETGYMKALLDGDFITAMRTACVAVNSIELFAIKDYKTIGFIGLGLIGQYIMDCLYHKLNGREVVIKLYNHKNTAQNFINKNKHMTNIKFEIYDTYDEVIKDSDVIISAVTYIAGLFCDNNDCYKKGCLVLPVHTRGFQNCDTFFDKVYCDDISHVEGFKDYDVFKDKLCEVSSVINKQNEGRINNDERIIVYNIGIAIHDIYFANKIYELYVNSK